MKKIIFLFLIILIVSVNCKARPDGFSNAFKSTWHDVKKGFKSIFGRKGESTTTATTTSTTE